jgi:hypothetical protein
MKTLVSAHRVALVAFALATAGITATFAQTATPGTTTPSTTPAPTCTADGGKHHHGFGNVLTDAEKAQLKKAYETAITSNPSLKTQEDALKQQFKTLKASGTATDDQKQALHQQMHDLHKQIEAAELAADPTLAPVFAKLKAAHKEHHSAA